MDLREQLPKLGKDVPEGVDFGIDKETMVYCTRPDYADLKRKKYNREVDCVGVLVGFCGPNTVNNICRERWWEFMEGPHHGLDQIGNPRFSFLGSAVGIFSDIREIIDIGIATNEIGAVLEGDPKLLKEERENDEDFSRYRWFDTLSFLNWMQQNGYPIPDELAIEKNGSGETVWADRSNKTKQTVTIPVPPGTKWFQIRFRIVNPNRIEIKTPDGMEPYHPDDLGFTPKTWDLFKQFASEVKHISGTLDGKAGYLHHSEAMEYINADKSDISRLRKLLKTAFPVLDEEDPIPHHQGKGYKAEFHIREA